MDSNAAVREHLVAIGRMTVAMSRATRSADIFAEALKAIRSVGGASRSSVLLFDPDGVMRFKAWDGLSDRYRKRVEGHTPWTPGQPHPEPIVLPDVTLDPGLAPYLDVIRAEGIHAMMMVPLVTGGGTIGKFMLYFDGPHDFEEHETALVQNIAAHTAFAVDRQRVVEALRESEERYRSVVDHLEEVVFQIGLDATWTFLNAAWEEITGSSVAERLGKPATEDTFPDDRDENRARFQSLATGETSFARFETRCLTKSGGYRWVEVCARPTLDAEGKILGVSGTLSDVTERRAAADALQEAEIRLRETQRLEALGLLAGGIAHDFNNLLVGILSNASLALSQVDDRPAVSETLAEIELAGRRAAELTKQLLAYSGKGKFVIQPLSLCELVEDSARLLGAAISKKATLETRFAPGVPLVEGDATQLRQVSMNLLINASDALGDQPGTIHVEIEQVDVDHSLLARAAYGKDQPEGAYVSLSVIDSGCGMDEATLARIFDPFFTSKFHGRGLGLAAVLGIVRGHKGAIIVDSAPGKGTRMQVLLPALGAEQRVVPPVPRPSRPSATARGRVLVVDDEPTVRKVVKIALEQEGYAAHVAEDGRKALDWLETRRGEIDLVLLDLTMPNLSGEETLEVLRSKWPELPVVLMSGYSDDAVPHALRDSIGFLQKPFELDALFEAVARAVKASGGGRS